MKFFKVNTFLFCISLETGGLVIGWLQAIFSVLLLASYILIFVALMDGDYSDETYAYTIVMVIVVLSTLYCVIVLIASIMLIRAVKTRNHKKLKMFMVVLIIGLIAEILQIWTNGYVSALISIVINLYCLAVIYSLHEKFKEEPFEQNRHFENATTIYTNQPFYPQQGQIYGQQGHVFSQPAPVGWQTQQQFPPPPQYQQYPQQGYPNQIPQVIATTNSNPV